MALLTCKELLDFLLDYVDGQLPPGERVEFERHLAVCPPCVAYLDSYRQTIEIGQKLAAREDEAATEAPEPLIAAILAVRPR